MEDTRSDHENPSLENTQEEGRTLRTTRLLAKLEDYVLYTTTVTKTLGRQLKILDGRHLLYIMIIKLFWF